MNNLFLKQFAENIKFTYTCFDRIVMKGYIRRFFCEGGLVLFLRAMGFKRVTKGVLWVFTDQLNAHIPCEFYFNGYNAIKQGLEEKGIDYRMKDNAFTWVEDLGAL